MIHLTGSSPAVATGLTQQLTQWASSLRRDDIPEAIRRHVAHLMLDGVGAGLFGSTTPWGRVVGDLVTEAGGVSEAAVWGSGVDVPATAASLANGTFMHSFEFDDLHPAAVIHGGAQVIPAVLAASGKVAATSTATPTAADVIVASVAGFEVGARIGLSLGAEQLARGFHPSPNTGLFSAAISAGLILGLDEAELHHAVGIAASSGGFLMAAQYGAMVKRMHPGRAAQAGVLAAELASRGFTGIDNVIEEPFGGFGHAYGGVEPAALADIADGLGDRWHTEGFGPKAYPCCGSNHTSIDAYRAIRDRDGTLTADQIANFDIWCSTRTAEHVGWSYEPRSVMAAQMNLSYTMAVLAVDGDLFVEQFDADRIADPAVLELAQRVRIHADPQIDALGREARHHVRLRITRHDGQQDEETVYHALGSAHRPLPAEAVLEKYRRLARFVLPPSRVHELEQAVLAIGEGYADPDPVRTVLGAVAGQ